jgi:hypothetical protein
MHPDGNHTWGDCYQNIANKDKKIPAKGSNKKGKTSTLTHEANLMVIEPAETATNHAPTGLVTAINEIELTGDELSAYMLDSFNKTLGRPSHHLTDLKKVTTKKVCRLIPFKCSLALKKNLSPIIWTKSHFLLNSRQ